MNGKRKSLEGKPDVRPEGREVCPPASPGGDISIARLKVFARERLPQSSALRALLLGEPNRLLSMQFLAKTEIWLKLLVIEIEEQA